MPRSPSTRTPILAAATLCLATGTAILAPTGAGLARPSRSAAAPLATPFPVTLSAVADTWAWRSVVPTRPPPPAVHGSEPSLETGVDDTRGVQVAVLRFDLSGLPLDWTRLHSASLRLYTAGETPRSAPRASDLHLVLGPWEEATLADEALPAIGPVLASAYPVPGSTVDWPMTDQVAAWLGGAPNHGVAITSAHDLVFGRSFASREARANQPLLEVWLMPHWPPLTPTPTTTPGGPTATATPIRPSATPSPQPPPSASPTPSAALPDLTGFASMGCYRSDLEVTVWNRGNAGAGPFWVRSSAGEPAWWVAELGAGSSRLLPPRPGPALPLLVDADDQVLESNERNNRIPVALHDCQALFLPYALRQR